MCLSADKIKQKSCNDKRYNAFFCFSCAYCLFSVVVACACVGGVGAVGRCCRRGVAVSCGVGEEGVSRKSVGIGVYLCNAEKEELFISYPS